MKQLNEKKKKKQFGIFAYFILLLEKNLHEYRADMLCPEPSSPSDPPQSPARRKADTFGASRGAP